MRPVLESCAQSAPGGDDVKDGEKLQEPAPVDHQTESRSFRLPRSLRVAAGESGASPVNPAGQALIWRIVPGPLRRASQPSYCVTDVYTATVCCAQLQPDASSFSAVR